MAKISIRTSRSIPFWRDVRVIAIVLQVVFVALVAALLAFLYGNMIAGLTRANLLPTFSFLQTEAGFPIAEGLPYDPSDSYGYAFIVGIFNTLRVALAGIVLATLLGVILGVARLSSNWLLRSVATLYVEVIRNVPLLLQLIFWLFLTKSFPRVQESIALGQVVFLHNRGVTLAWPKGTETFASWVPWLWAALAGAVVVFAARRLDLRRRDRPGLAWPWALLAALVIAAAGALVVMITSGRPPVFLELPVRQRFNFIGGTTLSANFTALLLGLTVYTATFIGEIVRSGILAVNKGQREAARALGLSGAQTLRLVIFPQALRVILPPTTSQYLNLTKNSSLAIAIGYQDLFSISGTMFNQTGQAVPVILLLMGSYLTVSLLVSLLMNWYNRRIQLVER